MQVTKVSPGVYRLPCFDENYLAAFSGREFPNQKHSEFLQCLGLAEQNLVRVKQVHGSKVLEIDSSFSKSPRIEADGLLTQDSGAALGILTADCVPVFFVDPVRRGVGLVHAGWRGIYAGIIQEMLRVFRERFKTEFRELQIAFGPAIRRCCYEVGPEFRDYFPKHFSEDSNHPNARRVVDLTGAISDILYAAGVPPTHIFDPQICTSCQNHRFFSARREKGIQERILSVIRIASKVSDPGV